MKQRVIEAKLDMDIYYIFKNMQQSELWSKLVGSFLVLITETSESTPPQSPHNRLSVPEQKKPDIRKCIICQKDKDNKGSTKLSSTETGRDKIISNSMYLEDKILCGISEREKAGSQ